MRKQFIAIWMILVLLLSGVNVEKANADIQYITPDLPGEGTEESPFLISSEDDLRYLVSLSHYGQDASSIKRLTGCYQLTNDIELTSGEWEPIFFLQGTIDGNGYTISGLTECINDNAYYTGVFGTISGTVKNLTVAGNANITNKYGSDLVGMLAGVVEGTIINCHASGSLSLTPGCIVGGLVGRSSGNMENCTSDVDITTSMSGDDSDYYFNVIAGCLAGIAEGEVTNCSASGNISGGGRIGGLLGIGSGKISYCTASGNVIGSGKSSLTGSLSGKILYCSSGGLIGEISYCTIRNCSASGTVGNTDNAGGLIGAADSYNSGEIRYCSASGTVINADRAGGLVGSFGSTEASTMSNCYSTCTVSGRIAGGLIGCVKDIQNTVAACYAAGNVFASECGGGLIGLIDKYDGYYYNPKVIRHCYSSSRITSSGIKGGLIGEINDEDIESHIKNSYYDAERSGCTDTNRGTPLLSEQMRSKTFFEDWDFNKTWRISRKYNDGYPFLRALATDVPSYQAAVDGWSGISHESAIVNQVSEKVWYAIFDESVWLNEKLYSWNKTGISHGICQGMAITSALTYIGSPAISTWKADAASASQYSPENLNTPSSVYGWTLSEFMQGMWAYQFSKECSQKLDQHRSALKEKAYQPIIDKTKNFEDTSNDPIVIVLRDWYINTYVGHVLVPYHVEDDGNTVKVYVYDCSWPSDEKYIAFYRENGKLVRWSFQMDDAVEIGAKIGDADWYGTISYLDHLESIGELMGFELHTTSDVLLMIQGLSFKIKTRNGKTAQYKNGALSSNDSGLIPVYTSNTLDGSGYDSAAFYLGDEQDFEIQNSTSGEMVQTIIANDTSDITVNSDGQSSVSVVMNEAQYTVGVTPSGDIPMTIAYTTSDGNVIISVEGTAEETATLTVNTGEENVQISGFQNATATISKNGIVESQQISEGSHQIGINSNGEYVFDGVIVNEAWFILPADLIRIEESAFEGCSFERVVLSKCVTSIGARAFAECKNLWFISIPEGVQTIADDAFEGCAGLTIYGVYGSPAEELAEKKGYNFIGLGI